MCLQPGGAFFALYHSVMLNSAETSGGQALRALMRFKK